MTEAINTDTDIILEALNEKVDRDCQNVDTNSGADAVVEYQLPTSSNGYRWYRLYKSGWIEQGGLQNSNTGAVGVTVYFLKSFNDTNYTITATVSEEQIYFVGCLSKTKTSFLWRSVNTSNQGYDKTGSWYACGMVEQS